MNYELIICSIIAYLLGSIPSAVWYGKLFHKIDVREHGSGNAGATNTLRVLGNKAGLIVLFFDFLKGFAATSLAVYLEGYSEYSTSLFWKEMVFGALAVIGHVWPIFAGFRGGKGIATILGIVVAMDPAVAGICVILFVAVVAYTRYISMGSMIAASASPLVAGFLHHWTHAGFTVFCVFIGAMVLYTHRTNIQRLRAGTENRFSFHKKTK